MFQAVPGMSFQPGHTILFDFCFAVFLYDKIKKICKSLEDGVRCRRKGKEREKYGKAAE